MDLSTNLRSVHAVSHRNHTPVATPTSFHSHLAIMTGAQFKTAVEDSKKLKAKPGDDELLQLYGLFKQATQDPPIDKSEAPGTFDFKGKAKRRAWQKVVDEGVTPTKAEDEYVKLVGSLKTKYGYDAAKKPEAVGGS